jgi:Ca2+/H+ antiporter, TMEM165/GDT1 family
MVQWLSPCPFRKIIAIETQGLSPCCVHPVWFSRWGSWECSSCSSARRFSFCTRCFSIFSGADGTIVELLTPRGAGDGIKIRMHAFLVSTGVVALAEIGDKSQWLVVALTARFARPLPIILGILAATVANHLLAGAAGASLAWLIGPRSIRWILGVSFLGMGVWTLLPERREEAMSRIPRWGVFGTTLATFFVMEMGDKTQIATIALAASYGSLYAVVAGSTLGILLADVPIVILGTVAAKELPLRSLRKLAPAIFLVIGVAVLLDTTGRW